MQEAGDLPPQSLLLLAAFSTFLAKVPQCLISRFPLLPFSLFCCSHSPIASTLSSASHPSSPALSHVFPSRGSTFSHPPPPLPQRAEAGSHRQPLEAHGVQQQPPRCCSAGGSSQTRFRAGAADSPGDAVQLLYCGAAAIALLCGGSGAAAGRSFACPGRAPLSSSGGGMLSAGEPAVPAAAVWPVRAVGRCQGGGCYITASQSPTPPLLAPALLNLPLSVLLGGIMLRLAGAVAVYQPVRSVLPRSSSSRLFPCRWGTGLGGDAERGRSALSAQEGAFA